MVKKNLFHRSSGSLQSDQSNSDYQRDQAEELDLALKEAKYGSFEGDDEDIIEL